MKRAILMSIKPKWCALILNGKKTVEVRKTAPKCELPITAYVYCTKGNYIGYLSSRYVGKVVAKFTLDEIYGYEIEDKRTWEDLCFEETTQKLMGMGLKELHSYVGDKTFYGCHISDLEIFGKSKELGEFGLAKAPQSWCYVEELK